jgi:uncharacterized protein YidB (DUF937 family)
MKEQEKRVAVSFLEWMDSRVEQKSLADLRDRFAKEGLSAAFNAWSRRGNRSLEYMTSEQVRSVFAAGELEKIATDAMVSPEEAVYALKNILPAIINRITPVTGLEGTSDRIMHFLIGSARQQFVR